MIKPNKLKIFKIFGVIFCILSMTGFTPGLDRKTEYEIKNTYAETIALLNTPVRKIQIDYYIGVYNDYHILMMSSSGQIFLGCVCTDTFDDITIYYYDTNILRGYKNKKFYKLPQLYEKGELTKEDIISIKEIFYEEKYKSKHKR